MVLFEVFYEMKDYSDNKSPEQVGANRDSAWEHSFLQAVQYQVDFILPILLLLWNHSNKNKYENEWPLA